MCDILDEKEKVLHQKSEEVTFPLDDKTKRIIFSENEKMCNDALRVVCLACKKTSLSKIEEDEKSIEDIIKDDEYIDYVDTKEYGLCKLYSSGFKKNGKVDLAFLDGNNKAHIFRDGKFV